MHVFIKVKCSLHLANTDANSSRDKGHLRRRVLVGLLLSKSVDELVSLLHFYSSFGFFPHLSSSKKQT